MDVRFYSQDDEFWVEIKEQLGKGGLSIVHRGQVVEGSHSYVVDGRVPCVGSDVAVKESVKDARALKQEIRNLENLCHDNIVNMYGFRDGALATEIFNWTRIDGELYNSLFDYWARDDYDIPFTAGIFSQIARAIDYAHRQGVVHGDLKPENVMFAGGGLVKLIDWSNPSVYTEEEPYDPVCVITKHYTHPDVEESGVLIKKTDAFALGIMIREFLTFDCFDADDKKLYQDYMDMYRRGIFFEAMTYRWNMDPEEKIMAEIADYLMFTDEDADYANISYRLAKIHNMC